MSATSSAMRSPILVLAALVLTAACHDEPAEPATPMETIESVSLASPVLDPPPLLAPEPDARAGPRHRRRLPLLRRRGPLSRAGKHWF